MANEVADQLSADQARWAAAGRAALLGARAASAASLRPLLLMGLGGKRAWPGSAHHPPPLALPLRPPAEAANGAGVPPRLPPGVDVLGRMPGAAGVAGVRRARSASRAAAAIRERRRARRILISLLFARHARALACSAPTHPKNSTSEQCALPTSRFRCSADARTYYPLSNPVEMQCEPSRQRCCGLAILSHGAARRHAWRVATLRRRMLQGRVFLVSSGAKDSIQRPHSHKSAPASEVGSPLPLGSLRSAPCRARRPWRLCATAPRCAPLTMWSPKRRLAAPGAEVRWGSEPRRPLGDACCICCDRKEARLTFAASSPLPTRGWAAPPPPPPLPPAACRLLHALRHSWGDLLHALNPHTTSCKPAAAAAPAQPQRPAQPPRPCRQRRGLVAASTGEVDATSVPNAAPSEGVAWDPDGLLPPPAAESHFARRAREKAAAAGARLAAEGGLRPVPAEHLAAGGLPAGDGSLYDRPAFERQMAERYLPVDLDTPGLRIMHLDPPVFTLPAFFSEQQCDDAVAAALESGTLVPSKVRARRAMGSLRCWARVRARASRLALRTSRWERRWEVLVSHHVHLVGAAGGRCRRQPAGQAQHRLSRSHTAALD